MARRSIFRKLVRGYRSRAREEKPMEPIPVRMIGRPPSAVGVGEGVEAAEEAKGEVKKVVVKGVTIPKFRRKRIKLPEMKEEEVEKISATYPLIPEKPTKGEPIMAYTRIGWSPKTNRYEYEVIQPELSTKLKELLHKIKDLLEDRLDVDFTRLKRAEARDYLHKQIFESLDYFDVKLSKDEERILTYFVDRDFIGLDIIEPFMHDPNIEDVSCDGVGIPIYVFHRDPSLGSIPTNVAFETEEELDSFLIRLAQLCGQAISVTDPLLSGSLPDGSRVQGTLATDIARRGSNFTIRKFTKAPFTPTHLLRFGTVDIKTLAFLWLAVDYGNSILVSGGTATGKTVFLNVLSLFIKPQMKIVSIEDTAELKLPHPHWIPHVARVPIATEAGKARGEVDLFDLLKESLRQRPDYIIVGEVRGKEAFVLFQQMATGHPSLATIHANNMDRLTDRLISPPIALPPTLLESLDLIVFLTKMRYKGKHVRKVETVHEITGFDFDKKRPITNEIFRWNPNNDKIEIKNESFILKRIIERTGKKEKDLVEELNRRMVILFWLQEQNILDYRDVGEVINLYYSYPERVLDIITGGV